MYHQHSRGSNSWVNFVIANHSDGMQNLYVYSGWGFGCFTFIQESVEYTWFDSPDLTGISRISINPQFTIGLSNAKNSVWDSFEC